MGYIYSEFSNFARRVYGINGAMFAVVLRVEPISVLKTRPPEPPVCGRSPLTPLKIPADLSLQQSPVVYTVGAPGIPENQIKAAERAIPPKWEHELTQPSYSKSARPL